MKAQQRSQVDRGRVRRPPRPAGRPADGLYRYVPVPPAYCDEDGYLAEDGMGQRDDHQCQTSLWYHALRRHLPAATVCADLFLHYRRDDKGAVLAPDLLVSLRVPHQKGRPSYKLWEDPLPELVVEMLSDRTSANDVGSKRRTYEHLGVREYWLFDPEGFELSVPLAGYQLEAGSYQPIKADPAGRLRSEVLGLDLHVRADELRFRDPVTGKDLRTYDESEHERAAAESRADSEKKRADAAENRADAEKNRADAEKNRADSEKNRADALARELARLRSRLQEL